jgi:hypothetical protein
MFTTQDANPIEVSQSASPVRQRNPEAADRRPTILSKRAPNVSNIFGGWGPRLG